MWLMFSNCFLSIVRKDCGEAELLGREPINLPGGRLARVRYTPIATKFCIAAKLTRWATSGLGRMRLSGGLMGRSWT